MSALDYHLAELEIAMDPSDPRRCMPTIAPHHRRVLDVGCGAGQTLAALGLTDASGVDVDAEAIRLGRERWPDLDLRVGTGEALPFEDASFDLVFSRVALVYMDVPRALAEMSRVLRPGGDLWLMLHPPSTWWKETGRVARSLRPAAVARQGYVLLNGVALHVLGRTFAIPGTRRFESMQTWGGIRGALHRAGFCEVRSEDGTHFVVTARRSEVAG